MASGSVNPDANALRYNPIRLMDREEALRKLAVGGSEAVHAIYSIALHDEDDSFAEFVCLKALDSEDDKLRSAAIGAIGEMTVYANREIDFGYAEFRLIRLRDEFPELSVRIQDALEDFALAKGRLGADGGERL